MKNKNIIANAKRNMHRGALVLKKNSPEILVVLGVIGAVASAVMACKATRKLDDVLDETKDSIDAIKEHVEENNNEYSEEDKKELATTYAKATVKVASLYVPSVILGVASISAILGGHNILRKRNIALAGAYTALDKGFKEYRGRVVEKFGEQVDKDILFNTKAKEFTSTTENEDGTTTEKKEIVDVMDPLANISPYAKFFDESCLGFVKNPEANMLFLRKQMAYANERFRQQGYLFLNDVYDMLGIPRTSAGQIVGWLYSKDNPIGDNMIDFGIYNMNQERNRDFVNGYESCILLDFNVDGPIYNMI